MKQQQDGIGEDTNMQIKYESSQKLNDQITKVYKPGKLILEDTKSRTGESTIINLCAQNELWIFQHFFIRRNITRLLEKKQRIL